MKNLWVFLLVSALLIQTSLPASAAGFTNCAAQIEIPVLECNALVAFYNSTNGAGWTQRTNWLVTDTPSNWLGLSVSGGHVNAIVLGDNHLTGTFPTQLGNLTELQTIYLSSNQIGGSLPIELGALTHLEYLYLSGNPLTGSLPTQLGNLKSLKFIEAHSNQFTGSIPLELTTLPNLEMLRLNGNQLSGSIPPELGNLTKLQELGLSANQLSGSIPPELGKLTNLQSLALHANQLSGRVPTELGKLTALTYLSFASNPLLSGSLPLSLTSLTSLKMFQDQNTALCEPRDPAFQTWKATVTTLWTSTGMCYTVMGRVTRWGAPLAGVTISSGGPRTAQSGVDGNYTLSELHPGNYTLTASLTGYPFGPIRKITLSDLDLSGQNFHTVKLFYVAGVRK